ncbi:MAG: metallophosphoesterase [candidate division WOR-3 bacterium]
MKYLIFITLIGLIYSSGVFASFLKLPYLQNLLDTSVVIRWETITAQDGKVQYGLSILYGLEVTHLDSTTQHELRLPSLMQDTVYHYRVISGPDTSPDYTFHSPVKPDKPFRFAVIGDTRTDSLAHQMVIDQLLRGDPRPAFILNTGDLTENGASSEYQTFFNIESSLLSQVCLFPALGNHDLGNIINWHTFFALPNNERWYTFRYGNSVFHCIDNYSPYTNDSPQYNWLVNELLSDSADPTIRHIFVFFHDPPYSTNLAHSSNLTIREYLCPLFERFNITFSFQGHNHCYERSVVNNIHYTVSGGGGAPLHFFWGSLEPWSAYRETTYEFVLIDICGDTISSQGIKPTGETFDHFSIIHRPEPDRTNRLILPYNPRLRIFPNPATGEIRITFALQTQGMVDISIYNSSGQKIGSVIKKNLPVGLHKLIWRKKSLASGTYLCFLNTPTFSQSVSFRFIR